MENLGRQIFDDSWRGVFSGAEGPLPSGNVWLAIDSALTATENQQNRRRVVFYQRIAASLLLLTTISAAVTYWTWRATPTTRALSETTFPPSITDPGASTSSSSGKKNNLAANGHRKIFGGVPIPKTDATTSSSIANGGFVDRGDAHQESDVQDIQERSGPSDSSVVATSVTTDEKAKGLTAEEEKELVAMLKAQIEETIIPEKKSGGHAPWLAVGAAAGSFAPQATTSGGLASAMDYMSKGSSLVGAAPGVTKPATGTSFSFGISAGKHLSRKWLLQTGLTYWKQQMDYQSNVTQLTGNVASAFSADLTPIGSAQVSLTAPYELSSTAEFLSVPIQAGYILVDRKIGWILNGGIATDLFLNNTLADRSGQYKSYSQDGGESVLYRRVSWSFMAGTEVNLRLSPHYRIALVPGVRYSFTNIYNTDSGTSRPIVFDVGLRFRYIF